MTNEDSLPLAEAKARISALVSRVSRQHDRITVTVHGRPAAVMIAPEDLDALEETIAILSDERAVAAIAQAEAELAQGGGETEDELAAAMRARRSAE